MSNDADLNRWAQSLVAMVVMLAVYVLALRAADRLLAPNDPKRRAVNSGILYGSTLLLLLILYLLKP